MQTLLLSRFIRSVGRLSVRIKNLLKIKIETEKSTAVWIVRAKEAALFVMKNSVLSLCTSTIGQLM